MEHCLICTETTATALEADALTETVVRVRPLGLRLNWYDLTLAATGLAVAMGALIHHIRI